MSSSRIAILAGAALAVLLVGIVVIRSLGSHTAPMPTTIPAPMPLASPAPAPPAPSALPASPDLTAPPSTAPFKLPDIVSSTEPANPPGTVAIPLAPPPR